jgi:hypothetical protein
MEQFGRVTPRDRDGPLQHLAGEALELDLSHILQPSAQDKRAVYMIEAFHGTILGPRFQTCLACAGNMKFTLDSGLAGSDAALFGTVNLCT